MRPCRAPPVAGEPPVEPGGIADVAALQRPPSYGPVMALLEGVVADRDEARFGHRLADVTADIARAAGNQHGSAHRLSQELVCCAVGSSLISHPSLGLRTGTVG